MLRFRPSALTAVAALLSLLGCSKSPTQLVVAIDSDLEVPAEISRVVVAVSWEGRDGLVERIFPLRALRVDRGDDRVALPFSFGVGAGASLDAAVTIVVRADDVRGEEVVRRRATTRFIPGQSLRLPMFLAKSCRGSDCPGQETCTELGCRSAIIDPATLQPTEPGEELFGVRVDAGEIDAGSRDALPSDAVPGDADAASGDAGVGDGDLAEFGVDAGSDPCAPPAPNGTRCHEDGLFCCDGRCVDTSSDELACGAACETCPSTESCIGGECRTCGQNADCLADRLVCTDAPTCEEGLCVEPLFPDWCLIDGECYGPSVRHPTDPCLVCDPSSSTSMWSINTGAACDDGLFCTANDLCTASAQCVGTGNPCPGVSDPCLTYTCDEDGNTCKDEIQSGSCHIEGACVEQGRPHPTNPCLACVPSIDQRNWSPNQGASCNDGRFCTATDVCNGQGQCVGTGSPCPAVPNCAVSSCDDTAQSCNLGIAPGFCLIGNACVSAGSSPANQVCMVCAPAVNQFDFSPRPNNTVCGVNALCCGGVCTGANEGACGSCTAVCPGQCFCGGQGDPFSCMCGP